MRIYQKIAFAYGYTEKKEPLRLHNQQTHHSPVTEITISHINWGVMPVLKKLSWIQFVCFIFFIYWTVLGTFYFGFSNDLQLRIP